MKSVGKQSGAPTASPGRWRVGAVPVAMMVIVAAAGFAGCGSAGDAAYGTLPPIITTTSTTSTTVFGDGMTIFYTVKPGDSLASIAQHFKVPLKSLQELNAPVLPNPNSLYVGTTLQIPTNVILVDTLPPLDTAPAGG